MNSQLRTDTARPQRLPASISACIAALISVAMLPSTALAQSGDMNCDGSFNIADMPLFVEALLATGSFGGCDINRANMNCDGLIDGRDTQAFVAKLLAPPCPGHYIWCNGGCVDPWTNVGHCGCCGNICGGGETCQGGVCIPAEPPP